MTKPAPVIPLVPGEAWGAVEDAIPLEAIVDAQGSAWRNRVLQCRAVEAAAPFVLAVELDQLVVQLEEMNRELSAKNQLGRRCLGLEMGIALIRTRVADLRASSQDSDVHVPGLGESHHEDR